MALFLSQIQLTSVDKTLRELADMRKDVEKAEACGLDCSNHKQVLDYVENRLTAIKTQFPPEMFPRT